MRAQTVYLPRCAPVLACALDAGCCAHYKPGRGPPSGHKGLNAAALNAPHFLGCTRAAHFLGLGLSGTIYLLLLFYLLMRATTTECLRLYFCHQPLPKGLVLGLSAHRRVSTARPRLQVPGYALCVAKAVTRWSRCTSAPSAYPGPMAAH